MRKMSERHKPRQCPWWFKLAGTTTKIQTCEHALKGVKGWLTGSMPLCQATSASTSYALVCLLNCSSASFLRVISNSSCSHVSWNCFCSDVYSCINALCIGLVDCNSSDNCCGVRCSSNFSVFCINIISWIALLSLKNTRLTGADDMLKWDDKKQNDQRKLTIYYSAQPAQAHLPRVSFRAAVITLLPWRLGLTVSTFWLAQCTRNVV